MEGYVESAAMGLLTGLNAARLMRQEPLVVPPPTSAHGALIQSLTGSDPRNFQPMNINFGLFPPLEKPVKQKDLRKRRVVERALEDFKRWIQISSLLEIT